MHRFSYLPYRNFVVYNFFLNKALLPGTHIYAFFEENIFLNIYHVLIFDLSLQMFAIDCPKLTSYFEMDERIQIAIIENILGNPIADESVCFRKYNSFIHSD